MKKSVFTAIFGMVGLVSYCQYAQADLDDLQKIDSQTSLFGKAIQSQEKLNKFSVGIKVQAGNIGLFGIEGEYVLSNEYKYSSAILLNINANALEIKTDYGNTIGTGFEIGIGSRKYLNSKSKKYGFYKDTYFNYGSVQFDDKLDYNNASFKVNGTYKYISIINFSTGYKFLLKNFVIEPSLSVRYNIELKGIGFVDNKDIENWLFHGGLKIGYSF
jgi:hypothetical protein